MARLVPQQPVDALLHEALLPAPDGRLGNTGLSHDLSRAAAFGRQQHDPSPPRVLLRAVAIGRNGRKPLAFGGGDVDDDTGAHAPDSHITPGRGNPKRTRLSDFIH
jgi:hypothetical protein